MTPLLTTHFLSRLQLLDQQSPQAFLDNEIAKRGYSVKKYSSLEGGYYCRPTPLQQASYGSRVSLAIRASGILSGRLQRSYQFDIEKGSNCVLQFEPFCFFI